MTAVGMTAVGISNSHNIVPQVESVFIHTIAATISFYQQSWEIQIICYHYWKMHKVCKLIVNMLLCSLVLTKASACTISSKLLLVIQI